MMTKIAQINLYDGNGFVGFGPLGLEQGQVAENVFQTFISSAIGLISIIAIIWFVIIIVTSGISYMGAGADQKATEAAKKRITNGLIGLLITIFGIFIINFAGQVFNVPNLLNIPDMFSKILIK